MGNAKGGVTKQKRGILENKKLRKAKGKETKTEQRIVQSDKTEYIDTGKFYFSQIQDFIEERNLQGYIIVGTPYTHFGIKLGLLKDTILHEKPSILTINAISTVTQKYNKCSDNFIFHSNMNVSKERRKIFNINMNAYR